MNGESELGKEDNLNILLIVSQPYALLHNLIGKRQDHVTV